MRPLTGAPKAWSLLRRTKDSVALAGPSLLPVHSKANTPRNPATWCPCPNNNWLTAITTSPVTTFDSISSENISTYNLNIMKYFAAITLALVGNALGGAFGGAGGAMAVTSPIGGAAWGNTRNWGPTAYGPGLNNRWAVPVNPFQMQQAINLAKTIPGTLVRVDTNGEIELTDQLGQNDSWYPRES